MKCILSLAIALLSGSFAFGSTADSLWVREHYTKKEVYVEMRDGKKLFTSVYIPNDGASKHPFLMTRTPYSIGPYGEQNFRGFWNNYYIKYLKRNYIMVVQDVRGRYMSEGNFVDVRPFNENNDRSKIDEATDTYDTIEWLLKNIKNNNGNVGVFGISYPGFYATEAALSGHPALKAVSPQAPVTEWFIGDDFHHNGAFMMMDAFNFYSGFGKPRPKPTTQSARGYSFEISDKYQFYMAHPTFQNLKSLMGDSVEFWKDLENHPNYDDFWQTRNTRNYVQHISKNVATLVTGGLYDAEDCYGAWNLYKAIEGKSQNKNKIVMGPWSHGGWARSTGEFLGNVRFGKKNSEYYQDSVEIPFFEYYLEGKGSAKKISEATIFFSGANKWKHYNSWPPAYTENTTYYFGNDGSLSTNKPQNNGDKYAKSYTSKVDKPVPFAENPGHNRTNEYMTDDQRFAANRPDVLVYQTEELNKDVSLAGPLVADIFTKISTTDADFIVKLIDVFPEQFKYDTGIDGAGNGTNYPMGGYQMLVRGEVFRGRYRNSFTEPQAFIPNQPTEVKFALPDVAHVFKKGHKIMVQVQSSWFPLVDRNPQQFVDIYTCTKADYKDCDITVMSEKEHPSNIVLPVIAEH